MAAAVFDLSDINNLMRELQGDVVLYPTFEHLFMESLYPDGIILDAYGRTQAQAEAAEEKFRPDTSRIITSKIPRALIMKNDKGLYICNNLKDELTPFRRGAIAFAKGCNPITDDDWANYTRQIAPGEINQIIPIADVVAAIRAKSETLVVDIGQQSQSAA